MTQDDSKLVKMTQDDWKWLTMTQNDKMHDKNDFECHKTLKNWQEANDSRWLIMTQDESKWVKMTQDDSRWLKISKDDWKWLTMTQNDKMHDKNDFECHKTLKNWLKTA